MGLTISTFSHRLTRVLNVRSLNVAQAFSEIIDGLIFWWAEHEVMKRVPTFKYHEILGLPTRKWIRVSILILIGYNLITLFTQVAVLALGRICKQVKQDSEVANNNFWQTLIGKHFHKRYVAYFANGMKFSISFIMSSLLLLLTWVLYFGSRLDMKIGVAKSTWEYGLWTLVCLLICSFLWLIKTFVLLAWEVHTVYDRLETKIKSTSEQLYFLGILGYDNENDILRLRHTIIEARKQAAPASETNNNSKKKGLTTLTKFLRQLTLISWFQSLPKKAKERLNSEKRERIKNDLLIREDSSAPTMDDLQRATQYFVVAKRFLLKETYISDVLKIFKSTENDHKRVRDKLQQIIGYRKESNNVQPAKMLMKKLSKNIRQSGSLGVVTTGSEDEQKDKPQSTKSVAGKHSDDFHYFVTELLGKKDPNSEIHFTDIAKWVERAHCHCVFLANTITSADEVAGGLNKIISWLLIGVIFIMWLLLTGLATTKVLVLIASPLLAATFIFGEACKTLFEGILFVYVVHPLDVGDLCIIDKELMEVTAIGIWTTTFTKVNKVGRPQEMVIHPNIELAKKVIDNKKTKISWTDCVEFNLGHVNMPKINNQEDFKKVFEGFLKKKEVDYVTIYDYTISSIEDNIMLTVCLTYNDTGKYEGWPNIECLREKDKLRANFCLRMKNFISTFKESHAKQIPQIDEPAASSTRNESVTSNSSL